MPNEKKPVDTSMSGLGDLLGQFSPKKWGPGAWGNGFLASLFLCLFIRCMFTKDSEKDKMWNDRLNDIKVMSQQSSREEIKKTSAELQPQIQDIKAGNDSLSQIVDSLKQKKT